MRLADGVAAFDRAEWVGVSVASAVKWSQRLRATGSAASRPMGGHRKRILLSEQSWMLERLLECPDLTVRGLALELRERGYSVSHNTVWSLLRQAGSSFKKTLFAIEQERPVIARRRKANMTPIGTVRPMWHAGHGDASGRG